MGLLLAGKLFNFYFIRGLSGAKAFWLQLIQS